MDFLLQLAIVLVCLFYGARKGGVALGLLLATALLPALAQAAPLRPQLAIAVGNGDFSDTANDGEIGGGLAGGSGNSVIGSGPWRGAFAGIASLLVPPTLTIGDGHAEIGNLLGVNIGGMGVLTLASILGLVISKRLGLRAKLIAAAKDAGVYAPQLPVEFGNTFTFSYCSYYHTKVFWFDAH